MDVSSTYRLPTVVRGRCSAPPILADAMHSTITNPCNLCFGLRLGKTALNRRRGSVPFSVWETAQYCV
jgi:hypothetical protein